MNVLYLINYAGKAGTEKYVENLVRILGKDKINPYFAYNIPGELSEKMKKMNVPSLRLDMGRLSVFTAASTLVEYCKENEIDLIHAQFPRENLIALLAKRRLSKLKVVMTSHLTLRLEGISRIVWRTLNKRFSPQNHRIISVCNEGRDIMIENGVLAERICVIFNGIEPSGSSIKSGAIKKELSLPEDCFVMTILARFAPEKGLSFLVDVLREVKTKTDKPFCCLICGDGELFDEIKRKVSDLKLENECRLLGFRSDTQKVLLGSDIYLCTSSHNEAMSFAVLEAMNTGLPVVVTDVGGNREMAETGLQCGFVVPFGDVLSFADSIIKFMEDPSLKEQYSKTAIEKIEKYFDLEKLADDVYKAYF